MRVEVLVPRASRALARATLSYAAPPALANRLAPGQLVAVPVGERLAVGIVWALDAADEVVDDVVDEVVEGAGSHPDSAHPPALKPVASLLLPEPVVLPAQRALAEQLADLYAAPLAHAVRLLLPPGLLASARQVLTLAQEPAAADGTGVEALPRDQAVVLAMLRDHRTGQLDREDVLALLGAARARQAIRGLLTSGLVVLGLALPEGFRGGRRARMVRLVAAPDHLDTWRANARAELDALTAESATSPTKGTTPVVTKRATATSPTERLLRQLAMLDVLSRAAPASASESVIDGERDAAPGWRYEELRRLTRATPAQVADLERAGLIAVKEVSLRHVVTPTQTTAPTTPPTLTPAQTAALATILGDNPPSAAPEASRVFLLHGITGSGKTEVYLQALSAVLARGQRGIVLVPEIALTPQALARFAGRFPGRVAVLHSGLSDAERLDEWRRIGSGAVDIVLGSRSALFAPVERLGIIIVDEEHEAAYKEERPPTYHAREVAVRLGALTGATVVLGSATPSVEAYWLAREGTYTLVELRERAPVASAGHASMPLSDAATSTQSDWVLSQPNPRPAATPPGTPFPSGEGGRGVRFIQSLSGLTTSAPAPTSLPPVTIVDLRAELRAGNSSILSVPLREALTATLERGEQAILFLNRRGTASSVVCRECGYVVRCRRCDVSLTYHAGEREVLCHYCGHREPVPITCPVCRGSSIRFFGVGTERIEMAVRRLFPAARVLRWDRDTAKTRQTHEELLRAFAERRADVLVGTQMIAKGLDLPGVTLVGVVAADIALNLPDFRASERAFQLLTQVAGRAGRGALPGQVLVQTFNPQHFCIQAASHHDYATFVEAELAARAAYGYPPFRRFVKCTFQHHDRYTAQVEAYALTSALQEAIDALAIPETDLVGPAPAFVERLRGRYRWQVLVRSPDPRPLLRMFAEGDLPFGWAVDVDPTSTL